MRSPTHSGWRTVSGWSKRPTPVGVSTAGVSAMAPSTKPVHNQHQIGDAPPLAPALRLAIVAPSAATSTSAISPSRDRPARPSVASVFDPAG